PKKCSGFVRRGLFDGSGSILFRRSWVNYRPAVTSTYTHAEGDVFWHLYQYRKQNKILGGKATLHVDRPLCGYCDERQGVKQLVEEVGLDELTVISPSGIQIIRSDPNFKRKSW
ncbi:hypothetical protein, partial [Thermoactinomyces sp. CICC 10522]|uniref:hypothetical protein n=1 Tax=Thermoactinomyces sp. CICC 10522 TaxID=2767427 RepID=UPI001E4E5A65